MAAYVSHIGARARAWALDECIWSGSMRTRKVIINEKPALNLAFSRVRNLLTNPPPPIPPHRARIGPVYCCIPLSSRAGVFDVGGSDSVR